MPSRTLFPETTSSDDFGPPLAAVLSALIASGAANTDAVRLAQMQKVSMNPDSSPTEAASSPRGRAAGIQRGKLSSVRVHSENGRKNEFELKPLRRSNSNSTIAPNDWDAKTATTGYAQRQVLKDIAGLQRETGLLGDSCPSKDQWLQQLKENPKPSGIAPAADQPRGGDVIIDIPDELTKTTSEKDENEPTTQDTKDDTQSPSSPSKKKKKKSKKNKKKSNAATVDETAPAAAADEPVVVKPSIVETAKFAPTSKLALRSAPKPPETPLTFALMGVGGNRLTPINELEEGSYLTFGGSRKKALTLLAKPPVPPPQRSTFDFLDGIIPSTTEKKVQQPKKKKQKKQKLRNQSPAKSSDVSSLSGESGETERVDEVKAEGEVEAGMPEKMDGDHDQRGTEEDSTTSSTPEPVQAKSPVEEKVQKPDPIPESQPAVNTNTSKNTEAPRHAPTRKGSHTTVERGSMTDAPNMRNHHSAPRNARRTHQDNFYYGGQKHYYNNKVKDTQAGHEHKRPRRDSDCPPSSNGELRVQINGAQPITVRRNSVSDAGKVPSRPPAKKISEYKPEENVQAKAENRQHVAPRSTSPVKRKDWPKSPVTRDAPASTVQPHKAPQTQALPSGTQPQSVAAAAGTQPQSVATAAVTQPQSVAAAAVTQSSEPAQKEIAQLEVNQISTTATAEKEPAAIEPTNEQVAPAEPQVAGSDVSHVEEPATSSPESNATDPDATPKASRSERFRPNPDAAPFEPSFMALGMVQVEQSSGDTGMEEQSGLEEQMEVADGAVEVEPMGGIGKKIVFGSSEGVAALPVADAQSPPIMQMHMEGPPAQFPPYQPNFPHALHSFPPRPLPPGLGPGMMPMPNMIPGMGQFIPFRPHPGMMTHPSMPYPPPGFAPPMFMGPPPPMQHHQNAPPGLPIAPYMVVNNPYAPGMPMPPVTSASLMPAPVFADAEMNNPNGPVEQNKQEDALNVQEEAPVQAPEANEGAPEKEQVPSPDTVGAESVSADTVVAESVAEESHMGDEAGGIQVNGEPEEVGEKVLHVFTGDGVTAFFENWARDTQLASTVGLKKFDAGQAARFLKNRWQKAAKAHGGR